jgi:hypothetical protein
LPPPLRVVGRSLDQPLEGGDIGPLKQPLVQSVAVTLKADDRTQAVADQRLPQAEQGPMKGQIDAITFDVGPDQIENLVL